MKCSDFAAWQKENASRDSIRKMLNEAGGPSVQKQRLSNWIPKNERMKKIHTAACEWVTTAKDRIANGEGVVLYGPVGTGKDHLAIAMAGQVAWDHILTTRLMKCRAWFGKLRDNMNSERDERTEISEYSHSDILIISDPVPAVGGLTQYQADMLYQLLEERSSKGRITIVTVNVATDDEADAKIGAATWDRMCFKAWKFHCNWESFRKPAKVI